MANNAVLAFMLTLSSSNFVKGMGEARSSMGEFIKKTAELTGVVALVGTALKGVEETGNVVKGVMEAIGRGNALQNLHYRTGESVSDLYVLQKAFQDVGLGADEVGPMITRLQKSMTGINDVGEDTNLVFSILGLNMADVRAMDAPAQFQAIAKAMQSINASQAEGLSGKLFGRESGANFLQLARQSQTFSQALRENAAAGAQMQRTAAAFNAISTAVTHLREKGENLFAGIAEGLAPAITKILGQLNRIDLSGIGQRLGDVFGAYVQAFQDGNLSEVIADTISTGLEIAVDMAPGILAKLGEVLLRVFETPLNFLSAGIDYVIQQLQAKTVNSPLGKLIQTLSPTGQIAVGALLGRIDKPETFDQIFARHQKEGIKFNVGTGDFGLADIKSAADEALKTGGAKASDALKAFFDRMKALADKGKAGLPKPDDLIPPGAPVRDPVKNFDPTSIEKMGFVFGGGGPTTLADHMRRTAENTAATAAHTATIAAAVTGGGTSMTPAMT